jgi:hypothetical protein
MAVDQFGKTYHNLTHPRKDLLRLFGRKHADKMYVDDKHGVTHHAGYIIAGLWLTILGVEPWK